MIVEGQIHGGLDRRASRSRSCRRSSYDESGNNLNTNFTEYLVPTSLETPHWETGKTPRPARTIRSARKASAKARTSARRPRSSTRSSTRSSPLGITNIDMPMTREKVWRAIRDAQPRHRVNLEWSGQENIPATQRRRLGVHQRSGEASRRACPTCSRATSDDRAQLRCDGQGRGRTGARQIQVQDRARAAARQQPHEHEDQRRRPGKRRRSRSPAPNSATTATRRRRWIGKATATMRGPVATIGGRVLDTQAQRIIATTFANVKTQLTAPA